MNLKIKFYIPHRREEIDTAQTTKVHIVYDALAKSSSKDVSLNDCLETGPNYKI